MTLDRNCVSVVVPIYNEQDTLRELWQRLQASLAALPFETREILLVSDGSTDGSEEIIADLVHRHAEAKGVFLTRNFGHQAAVSIGLAESNGSVVAVMDGDLQDPPEVLPRLVAALEAGADVAYGIRKNRKETTLRRRPTTSSIVCCTSSPNAECLWTPVTSVACGVRSSRRSSVCRNATVSSVVCVRGWVIGKSASSTSGTRGSRADRNTHCGACSAWPMTASFPFSKLPARAIQFTGFLIALVSLLVALAYVVWYLLAPQSFPRGFATLVVSIWFLGGVQLFSLGVLGEYVTRTCDESRRRPVALVRQVLVNPKCPP